MDWLYLLFLMLLYAVIPCIPAVLLRAKFQGMSKWIAVAATVIGIACFILIISGDDMMMESEELATFAQCALTSSVPVLYCVAFCGAGNIWIALAPSLMYFLAFFMRYISLNGFILAFEYIVSDPSTIMVLFMSGVFFVWALICVFITRLIYKFIIIQQEKIKNKKKSKRRRPGQI